jgi:hypothetical protein
MVRAKAKISVTATLKKETNPPKNEPLEIAYMTGKIVSATISGMSNILMKERKTAFEMSRLERGRVLKTSAIFEETKDVAT